MNDTPRRLALVGLAAFALLTATPAVAAADASYYSDTFARASATSASFRVRVVFARHGRAYFRDTIYWAGPNGSGVRRVVSRAG
jgi:hypothetical protein